MMKSATPVRPAETRYGKLLRGQRLTGDAVPADEQRHAAAERQTPIRQGAGSRTRSRSAACDGQASRTDRARFQSALRPRSSMPPGWAEQQPSRASLGNISADPSANTGVEVGDRERIEDAVEARRRSGKRSVRRERRGSRAAVRTSSPAAAARPGRPMRIRAERSEQTRRHRSSVAFVAAAIAPAAPRVMVADVRTVSRRRLG